MMKKMMNTFLVLFVAGGFHAMAEEGAVADTDTKELNSKPTVEETTTAKKKPKKDFKRNIFYGGYINLSFGDYMVIGIEPMIGYKVTPKLSAGVKLRYDYIRDDRYPTTFTTSTYGGSVFGRYLVTPKFYAQAEAATYSYEYYYSGDRDWVPFLLVGGGYIQPLSERTWLNVQILFDIVQDEKSPYDDWQPFFSIGVGAGF